MKPLKEIQVEDNPSLHHPVEVSFCIFKFIFSFKIQEENGKKEEAQVKKLMLGPKGQLMQPEIQEYPF